MKKINLEDIKKNSKSFYEICTEINVLQRQLEQMLNAIEKNSRDYQKGNISRDLFSYNERKLKSQSAGMIKKINSLVKQSSSYTSRIERIVDSQRMAAKKFNKKRKIEEIKKMAEPKPDQEAN